LARGFAVNHEVTSEQFNDWLTPLKMRLMQTIQRSSQLQRLSLVITNVAGSIVMLSPVIVFLVASIITIHFAYTSRGPLDWFFCLAFFGITLVSGYLSIQLHQLRLTDTDGVSVVPQQAPELLGMIERRVSHFGIRAPDRILLTVGSELKIMRKPHWPVPLMHKTMLWVGAPLLFFVTPRQFRLALAGAIAEASHRQKGISGWALQATDDWPLIVKTLESGSSLLTRVLLKPARNFRDITAAIGKELRAESRHAKGRWLLENSDEASTINYLAAQVVASMFLTEQFWPMIYKGAEKSTTPNVKPFTNFEVLLENNFSNALAKRWLLQAQAGSLRDHHDLRDLLADLNIDHLDWHALPETVSFHKIFESAGILKRLDTYWRSSIEADWSERHARWQKEKVRFDSLLKKARDGKLHGSSAIRFVQMATRFLAKQPAVIATQQVYQSNQDSASVCFASGRELLRTGNFSEGTQALQRAAELDNSLANGAYALINQHNHVSAVKKRSNRQTPSTA
jgi:hypothetical protein